MPKDIPIFKVFSDLNTLLGLFGIYHSAFFPNDLHWDLVLSSAIGSVIFLIIGWLVYSRTIRSVLKEM